MQNNYYPFINLPLPYKYDALEPFIDEKTMQLHHDRHLQSYIDNLNKALENQPALQAVSLEMLIKNADKLPCNIQKTIRNNAGGVYNHRFFFDILTKPSSEFPAGRLRNAIYQSYENYPRFKDVFKQAALSVFGSGYAWLVSDRGRLQIITTANQNTPLECGLKPILTLDVWEHAYYLKHYNMRSDYIDSWFHIINWEQAEQNFDTKQY